jgi:prevent-host-death family protein
MTYGVKLVRMVHRLPIAAAKARFAECIRRAERGEVIVLMRHGRPVARLAGLDAGSDYPVTGGVGEDGARLAGEVRESSAALGTPQPPSAISEGRRRALARLLEEEIWPRVPEELLDQGISKQEREEILGLGGDEGEV